MRSTSLPSWSKRLLGLASVAVPPHAFAIEPGRLSYARFERSGGGFTVSATRTLELPADGFHQGLLGGTLKEVGPFRDALASLQRDLPGAVHAASLVLPDAWVRIAFSESGDLPANGRAREDILRFKLKRLVPFRVDDLRLTATEVTPLPQQAEPRRLLLGFGLENLLGQLEGVFRDAGVHLGQITTASLATLGAVTRGQSQAGRTTLVHVAGDGYTLLFAEGDEPLLCRYKPTAADLDAAAQAGMVRRDLRLTRNYLEDQLGGSGVGRVVLAAHGPALSRWAEWIREGLEAPVEELSFRHLAGIAGLESGDLFTLAPLAGAATREVE